MGREKEKVTFELYLNYLFGSSTRRTTAIYLEIVIEVNIFGRHSVSNQLFTSNKT